MAFGARIRVEIATVATTLMRPVRRRFRPVLTIAISGDAGIVIV